MSEREKPAIPLDNGWEWVDDCGDWEAEQPCQCAPGCTHRVRVCAAGRNYVRTLARGDRPDHEDAAWAPTSVVLAVMVANGALEGLL